MKLQQISIIIVEDDPITAQDLKETLIEAGFKVLITLATFEAAIEAFKTMKSDLILVDVNLKSYKSGIDLVKEIRNIKSNQPVVYLTGNSDIFTKNSAFKTEPSAFLTKPFNTPNLISSLELAFDKWSREKSLSEPKRSKYIFLKSGHEMVKVNLKDILFIKAAGSYSEFVTINQSFMQSHNLHYFEDKFRALFVRIHKSYLVNIDHVSGVFRGEVIVKKFTLPLGRAYKENLL